MNRMVRWLVKNVADPEAAKIIGIGCGNGIMTIELYENGFENVEGVNYSRLPRLLSRQGCHVNFPYFFLNLVLVRPCADSACLI